MIMLLKRYCTCGCKILLTSKNRDSLKYRIKGHSTNLKSSIKRLVVLYLIISNKKLCYKFYNTNSGQRYAKRLWELYYDKLWPKNMFACHSCDNSFCINIFHIFPGTNSDNRIDSVTKDRHARGERNSQAKLIDSEVLEIRLLYASGKYTYNDLAKMFDIIGKTVRDILNKKTWLHLK